MLDKEQRRMVIKLLCDGMGVSKVGKEMGVSTQAVYRVIRSVLKKRLRKTELYGKIREGELRKPLNTMDAVAAVNGRVDGLMSWVLGLWYMNPKLGESPPVCLYCGEELEYVEGRKGGRIVSGCCCSRCRKFFPFP